MKAARGMTMMSMSIVLLAPVGAWAHGDATTTVPTAGDRVKRAPQVIRIDFSEPPTQDSKYSVIDGCGDEVLSDVVTKGDVRELVVQEGRPGRWKASYNVISSIDGHHTKDRFTFTVAGQRDCVGEPDDEISPEIGDAAPPVTPDGEPASFPMVPVAVGAAVLIGAIAIRLLASR